MVEIALVRLKLAIFVQGVIILIQTPVLPYVEMDISLDLKYVMMATPMKMTGDLVIVASSILSIPARLELALQPNQSVHKYVVMDTTPIVLKIEMMVI